MRQIIKEITGDFSKWNTAMLCRAGAVAALYVVLTWALGSAAFGMFQIRPAEALTLMPLLFPETIPALFIGCMIANMLSAYGVYDIFLGSMATLAAAACTYLAGKLIKGNALKAAVGGLFPVIINAAAVPAIWILAGTPNIVYAYEFLVMMINEAVWVYALGVPLYAAVVKLRKKGVKILVSPVSRTETRKPAEAMQEMKQTKDEEADSGTGKGELKIEEKTKQSGEKDRKK